MLSCFLQLVATIIKKEHWTCTDVYWWRKTEYSLRILIDQKLIKSKTVIEVNSDFWKWLIKWFILNQLQVSAFFLPTKTAMTHCVMCNPASLVVVFLFFFPDVHPTGINSHLAALDTCHPELGTDGNEGSPLWGSSRCMSYERRSWSESTHIFVFHWFYTPWFRINWFLTLQAWTLTATV